MNLRVYQLAEILADEIWIIVNNWKYFEKETVENCEYRISIT
jgi:hypothetical protein